MKQVWVAIGASVVKSEAVFCSSGNKLKQVLESVLAVKSDGFGTCLSGIE